MSTTQQTTRPDALDQLIARIHATIERATRQLRRVEDWLHESVAAAHVLLREAESIGYLDALIVEMRNHTSSTRRMRSNEMRLGYFFFPGVGKFQNTSRTLFVAGLEWLATHSGAFLMSEKDLMMLVRAEGLDTIERQRIEQRVLQAVEREQFRQRQAHQAEAAANRRAAKAAGMAMEEHSAYLRYKQSLTELVAIVAALPNQPVILRRLVEDGVLTQIPARPLQDGVFLGTAHRLFRIGDE